LLTPIVISHPEGQFIHFLESTVAITHSLDYHEKVEVVVFDPTAGHFWCEGIAPGTFMGTSNNLSSTSNKQRH